MNLADLPAACRLGRGCPHRWSRAQTSAAVRFMSGEPLLEAIKIPLYQFTAHNEGGLQSSGGYIIPSRRIGIDWVIVGGESGPGARPMDPNWARGIRDQCVAAGVPFFFKGWGVWVPVDQWKATCQEKVTIANSGRVHHWPDGSDGLRIGKKAAGRLLDGQEHNEMPALRGQRKGV